MSDPIPTTFYVCIQTASVLWAIPPIDLAQENHLRVYLSDTKIRYGIEELYASISCDPPDGSVVLDSQYPEAVTDLDLSDLAELIDTGLIFSTAWSGSFLGRFAHLQGYAFSIPSRPLKVKVG